MQATDAVRSEWLRRIEAEYRSAALTQHLTLWLIQIGVAPELIESGLRIVREELSHAELSASVYAEAGGTKAPRMDRASLAFPSWPQATLESGVLVHGVEMFCLGETVAVRLFHRLRQSCTVEIAREALDQILLDEVGHRDFGWSLLEWLLSTARAAEFKQLLSAELPNMLRRIKQNYAAEAQATRMEPYSGAERAWGLMPAELYAEALEETIVRDYEPRFAALGIKL